MDDFDASAGATLVQQKCREIAPILAGVDPAVQGAILADLLATWLAGHVVPDHAEGTELIRDTILRHHVAMVREMVDINAMAMGTYIVGGKGRR